jgi:ABC-type bacteriocin/lantibiotic exporter with double-glycine peptidase domain
MKKYIKQEDSMGCGIACVAYVLGISYEKAVNLFTQKQKRETRGFTSKDITEAIKMFSVNYKSVYVGREKEPRIENNSIVYVPKCDYFPYGHYLVKIQDGYMDPFINLHESNFDYTKAKAGLRRTLPNKISMKIIPVPYP